MTVEVKKDELVAAGLAVEIEDLFTGEREGGWLLCRCLIRRLLRPRQKQRGRCRANVMQSAEGIGIKMAITQAQLLESLHGELVLSGNCLEPIAQELWDC